MQVPEQAIRNADLIVKYLRQTITPDEQQELDQWLATKPEYAALFSDITNEQILKQELTIAGSVSAEEAWKRLSEKIATPAPAVVVPIKKGIRKWWMAAAAVFAAVLLITIYQLLPGSSGGKQKVSEDLASNIQPGGDRALLRLADGSVIVLDSAANGNLADQGAVKVIKLDGKLTYLGNEPGTGEPTYNTITTPRGGQYQLVLSDGSVVWLNAASSLRFPVVFTGNERRVEITGEAYFEVAKNAKQPFKVAVAGRGEVEVLGTHFNINAYADEATINTTLLEGSVKVTAKGATPVQLKPGQQAQMGSSVSVINNVDTEEVIAWKTGWFSFDRTDIATIMRQVSRWYNVDVVFDGQPGKRTFSGVVSRSNSMAEVLKIMEKAGVRFHIEGKKVTVSSN
jgi:ferric-dicitrate binding protein FerR (iron transport regulator)